MKPKVPSSVGEEYESLYQSLKDAVNVPGNVGLAAKDAFRLVQTHYTKDKEYALPPLKFLSTIAEQNITGEIEKISNMTARLKRELPHFRRETENIAGALERLADVALRENKREYHGLARNFIRFLQREEQILYPAAILIGDLIEAKADLEGRKLAQLHA